MLESVMNILSSNQCIILAGITKAMFKAGMSQEFVGSSIELSLHYEGVYDLMLMWSKETDSQLRDEIIADLQDEIDESSRIILSHHLEKKGYLHFDNLDEIAKNVMIFKMDLKVEIERWGGVSKLAKKTGIPQASLSRFLNTPSLPRRSTIEKIAKALNLKESTLLSKWQSP